MWHEQDTFGPVHKTTVFSEFRHEHDHVEDSTSIVHSVLGGAQEGSAVMSVASSGQL
jgi:hypothetical protein